MIWWLYCLQRYKSFSHDNYLYTFKNWDFIYGLLGKKAFKNDQVFEPLKSWRTLRELSMQKIK